VKAHSVVRRRGSRIFEIIGSQMAVRLLALRAGRPLPPERFLVLISVRVWVDLRAIVRLEGWGQLKNPITSSGIEPATFRLVAQCLNQVRSRVPPAYSVYNVISNIFQKKYTLIGWKANVTNSPWNILFVQRCGHSECLLLLFMIFCRGIFLYILHILYVSKATKKI
jgi:hypothetical protein